MQFPPVCYYNEYDGRQMALRIAGVVPGNHVQSRVIPKRDAVLRHCSSTVHGGIVLRHCHQATCIARTQATLRQDIFGSPLRFTVNVTKFRWATISKKRNSLLIRAIQLDLNQVDFDGRGSFRPFMVSNGTSIR